ncbi:hypothetical protein SBDP1_1440002 [Syntrophobacter sp. SbD1]|nr:hypothetical protein SBDP1_1440002 [Syntrophobacter sp. SbD1]
MLRQQLQRASLHNRQAWQSAQACFLGDAGFISGGTGPDSALVPLSIEHSFCCRTTGAGAGQSDAGLYLLAVRRRAGVTLVKIEKHFSIY